eukprot:scaffold11091_cov75-Phaeocystis_antarctica.AAC.14
MNTALSERLTVTWRPSLPDKRNSVDPKDVGCIFRAENEGSWVYTTVHFTIGYQVASLAMKSRNRTRDTKQVQYSRQDSFGVDSGAGPLCAARGVCRHYDGTGALGSSANPRSGTC